MLQAREAHEYHRVSTVRGGGDGAGDRGYQLYPDLGSKGVGPGLPSRRDGRDLGRCFAPGPEEVGRGAVSGPRDIAGRSVALLPRNKHAE